MAYNRLGSLAGSFELAGRSYNVPDAILAGAAKLIEGGAPPASVITAAAQADPANLAQYQQMMVDVLYPDNRFIDYGLNLSPAWVWQVNFVGNNRGDWGFEGAPNQIMWWTPGADNWMTSYDPSPVAGQAAIVHQRSDGQRDLYHIDTATWEVVYDKTLPPAQGVGLAGYFKVVGFFAAAVAAGAYLASQGATMPGGDLFGGAFEQGATEAAFEGANFADTAMELAPGVTQSPYSAVLAAPTGYEQALDMADFADTAMELEPGVTQNPFSPVLDAPTGYETLTEQAAKTVTQAATEATTTAATTAATEAAGGITSGALKAAVGAGVSLATTALKASMTPQPKPVAQVSTRPLSTGAFGGNNILLLGALAVGAIYFVKKET
jgi:hypothetical protein